MKHTCTIALGVAMLSLAPALASAAPIASPDNVAQVPTAPYRDLGRAPMNTRVHLAVVLQYRNEAELDQLVARQGRLPKGLHTLTAAQFRDYFSPTPAQYQQVERSLMARGLTISRTYPNRTVIDVTAPSFAVERAFGTEIHSALQPAQANGVRAGTPAAARYVNVKPATLPAELRTLVYGVTGFDNLRVLHPAYVRGSRRLRSNVALSPPLQAPDTGLGPFAFVNAYDYPVQHSVSGGAPGQTYDGTGQATAVVIDSDYTESDLTSFLSYFNITRTGPPTTRILIQGGPTSNFDAVETTLDVETIVGTSPGTSLYLYLPDALSYASIIDAYNQVDSDDYVDAVDSSFGGCEQFTSPSYFPGLSNYLAKQGALLGITYSASTGDSGTFECTFTAPGGVSTPASGPSFIAAGATTLFLRSNGAYVREFGWSGSGGGVSHKFGIPAYQVGVPHVKGKARNLPDVGFDGDPGSGAAFFFEGAWNGPIGGTSLSSPLFTSLVTQWDEINGTRLGDVHPIIYGLFKTYGEGPVNGAALFNDAIGGNNGFYKATPGYDNVTGIGSIDGWNFAQIGKL